MRKAAASVEKQTDLLEKIEGEKPKAVDKTLNDPPQNEPEIEVVVEGSEPEKVIKEPEKQEDTVSLQKQLEDLKRSEEAAVQAGERLAAERAAALKAQEEMAAERDRYRSESSQSQLDAINTAIAAATAEAEGAERDIETAINTGNVKLQVDASRRLAKAEGNLGRLEDGKSELEYRIRVEKFQRDHREKVEKKPEQIEKTEETDPVEMMQVPERAKEWLREHRDFVTDARKNAKLQAAHWDALDEGHKAFSTDYFVAVEKIMGLREADKPAKTEKSEPKRTPIVSAPVSRDGPSGSGGGGSKTRVTLTEAQVDAARIAGISPEEYAKQFLKLEEAKKAGLYGEGR